VSVRWDNGNELIVAPIVGGGHHAGVATMIKPTYIHITGASGCGTTTLGRALAAQLSCAHLDADEFFWEPTTPPYQRTRSRPDRLALILTALHAHPRWVLSGSICGWGAALEQAFDLVVFLTVRKEVRLQRLVAREEHKLGHADPEFIAWAAQYDEGGPDVRSRALHEQWLTGLTCPVIRLDGERPVAELVHAALQPSGQ
jgi:adenylate kinase family enzyme